VNLSELAREVKNLSEGYIITEVAMQRSYFHASLDKDIPEDAQKLFPGATDFVDFLARHCEAQASIIKALQRAFEAQHKNYPDVVQFVFGSVAKLEFIPGVSDVDILPILKTPARPGRRRTSPKFEEYVRDLKQRIGRSGLSRKKVSVSGIPLAGSGLRSKRKEGFYRRSDLVGKLDNFDEPSWAVSHRGSLIFECAYHESGLRAEKIRSEIAKTYDVRLDFNDREFPFLASLLLGFLRISGLIPKMREAKALFRTPIGDSVVKASSRRKRPRKRVGNEFGKTRATEMLKALSGRAWNSIVHIVTLHTLYWSACILQTSEELDHAATNVNRAPTLKLIDTIPTTIGRLRQRLELNREGWYGEVGLDEPAAKEIERLLAKIHGAFGTPTTEAPTAEAPTPEAPILPIARRYLYLLVVSAQVRARPMELSDAVVDMLSDFNRDLFELLEMCEKITLTLIARRGRCRVDLIRLFGREVFDRKLMRDGFTVRPDAIPG
jgi:hypothetical protein